ncbi:MAG: radical SAM protein [Archaeoglobus sp.]|jgi:radical SAM superfamily enzyme YgiQ (UPF0313 family)|nr:MAG: radical SAM protein [Archaeoglobus sp.]
MYLLESKAEHNPLFKRWKKGDKRVALVYPNAYAGGIANIGLHQIYAEVNSIDGFVCERFYGNVFNCERSIESGTKLKNFDVALFSIQFEDDYFKLVDVTSKAGNAIKIAGGPCILENPLPLTPYFDYFYIGEVDGDVERLLEVVFAGDEEDCIIKSETVIEMSESGDRLKVRKELGQHLTRQIVGCGVYGKCYLIEVGRGCRRGCSFCVVRQIYRPCRWRNEKEILEVAENAKKVCNKVALISPSVTDHPNAKEFMWELVNMNLEVSPSSMRADTIDEEMAELLVACGQKSITIAPEAGSERLRRVLRKGLNEEKILYAANCIAGKIKNLKMYYMIGLPEERDEDIKSILKLTEKIKKLGFKVSVSINPLIPKPHTPLQFAPFGGKHGGLTQLRELKIKAKMLESDFRKIGVNAKIEKPEKFAVQTILSRGGADVGKALSNTKSTKSYLLRRFSHLLGELNFEKQPWEFIDHGYRLEKLRSEYENLIIEVC